MRRQGEKGGRVKEEHKETKKVGMLDMMRNISRRRGRQIKRWLTGEEQREN